MRLVQANEVARRRMRQQRAHRRRRTVGTSILVVVAFLLVSLFANSLRPLPSAALELNTTSLQVPAAVTSLNWPDKGQAALFAEDYGLLGSYGSNEQIPTASIAKVLTALCVLEKQPLEVGEQGPTITFSKSDVALYQYQLSQNGSNVPVYEGTQMTLYQALEAILIPSANNIADSLAIWAFGSLEQYAAYANEFAVRNELVRTTVGSDASGLDSSTQSTATDIVRLTELARENDVIMEIAGKKSTTLPNAGVVYNYNTALGVAGITGLKTGNNEDNKGALAFTANIDVAGQTIPISGTVLGQDSLNDAITQSITLVQSIAQNFEKIAVTTESTVLGSATTPWGETTPVVGAKPVTILRWKANAITSRYTLQSTTATDAETVGAIEFSAGTVRKSVNLEVTDPVNPPNVMWRATRLH